MSTVLEDATLSDTALQEKYPDYTENERLLMKLSAEAHAEARRLREAADALIPEPIQQQRAEMFARADELNRRGNALDLQARARLTAQDNARRPGRRHRSR